MLRSGLSVLVPRFAVSGLAVLVLRCRKAPLTRVFGCTSGSVFGNKMKPQAKTTLVKRRTINSSVRQIVLLEAGYKCANPSCRHILTLELHHIAWVKEGGSNDPSNLVALCPNCHSLHTTRHIPHQAINAWKSLLVSLNNPHRVSADL